MTTSGSERAVAVLPFRRNRSVGSGEEVAGGYLWAGSAGEVVGDYLWE